MDANKQFKAENWNMSCANVSRINGNEFIYITTRVRQMDGEVHNKFAAQSNYTLQDIVCARGISWVFKRSDLGEMFYICRLNTFKTWDSLCQNRKSKTVGRLKRAQEELCTGRADVLFRCITLNTCIDLKFDWNVPSGHLPGSILDVRNVQVRKVDQIYTGKCAFIVKTQTIRIQVITRLPATRKHSWRGDPPLH